MTPRSRLAAILAVALFAGGPAAAQEIVHDPMNYASLIQQAKTGISQLKQLQQQVSQAQQLYDGFNTASHVGTLATVLDNPAVRAVLPDVATFTAAAKGDFSGLQQIGQQAAADPPGQPALHAGGRRRRGPGPRSCRRPRGP